MTQWFLSSLKFFHIERDLLDLNIHCYHVSLLHISKKENSAISWSKCSVKLVHIQFNSPESLFGHRCPCFSTQQCPLSFRVNWWYTLLLARVFSFKPLTSFWKLFCLVQRDNPFTLVMKHNSVLSTCGYLPCLSPIKLCFSNFHVHTNHLRILLKSRYKTSLGESLSSCSAHVPPWGEFNTTGHSSTVWVAKQ